MIMPLRLRKKVDVAVENVVVRRKAYSMKTLKVLGFFLTYPTLQHKEVLAECREILVTEKVLNDQALASMMRLMEWMEGHDVLDLQEEYVNLFDRTPSLSLHLFEHVHGDSRERGQALVNLNEIYTAAGLMISTEEMPDYLPLFLEYLSILPAAESSQNLADAINVIGAVGERLKNRTSLYAGIFESLQDIAKRKPDAQAIAAALQKSKGDALKLDELDKEWTEQFAFENSAQTTVDAGQCPSAQDMVNRMNRPVTGPHATTPHKETK